MLNKNTIWRFYFIYGFILFLFFQRQGCANQQFHLNWQVLNGYAMTNIVECVFVVDRTGRRINTLGRHRSAVRAPICVLAYYEPTATIA